MAEAQAQNKLGELFVDLGVGGLGKTLKALNSVSATFLMTKNAAQQAVQPFINMSKEGANFATVVEKIRSETGLARTQIAALQIIEKTKQMEGLTNALSDLQQKILNAKVGTSAWKGFNLLGLDPNMLNQLNPVEAFDIIKDRLKSTEPAIRTMALKLIDMPKELGYAFDQLDGSLADILKKQEEEYGINEESLDLLREQQELWKKIEAETAQIGRNISSWGLTNNALRVFEKDINNLMWVTNPENKEEIKENIQETIKNPNKRNAALKKALEYSEYLLPVFGPIEALKDHFLDNKGNKTDNPNPDAKNATTNNVNQQPNEKTIQQPNEANKSVATAVGATVLQGGEQVDIPVPNVSPSSVTNSTNNSSTVINYNNVWNNQFDGLKSADDMFTVIDTLEQQIGFTEYKNTANT